MKRLALFALVLALAPLVAAREEKKDKDKEGFVPMFDGKTLDGWVRVNNAPGTFFVKDKQIVTTGKPTGFMRTAKQYENFVMEVEWMHVPPKKDAVGNSGIFVWADPLPAVGTPFARAIEVQVLVNLLWKDEKSGKPTATSYGDLFSIWGARCVPDRPHPKGWERCIPSEDNAKGANEWNHYKITAKDGVIKLAVNGKEVSGVSKCRPRKGYLALEAEGSECRFRNLKIKELPSSKPEPDEVADEAKGFMTLFTGLNLDGWDAGDQKENWTVGDNVIRFDGKAKGGGILKTEKEYGDFQMIADVKLLPPSLSLEFGGGNKVSPRVEAKFERWILTNKGGESTLTINGKEVARARGKAGKGPITLRASTAAQFMNLFVRDLK
jgi:hypothetical protein